MINRPVLLLAVCLCSLLWSCATSTSPVTTCTCQDTTLQHDGQLSVAAGAPLAQVSVGIRRVHRTDSDSLYSDVFAGAEKQAGIGGTTFGLGELRVGDLYISPATNAGVTLYQYRGASRDLPSNATGTIGFAGNSAESVAPYSTSMFIGGPLNVLYYGLPGDELPDTLDARQDLVLTWTPGPQQPATMRVLVEIRNNSGITVSTMDYSGPDDGKEVIPQEVLPEVGFGTLSLVVLAERSFNRCSCQTNMQYNLVSWSQQYLFRKFR